MSDSDSKVRSIDIRKGSHDGGSGREYLLRVKLPADETEIALSLFDAAGKLIDGRNDGASLDKRLQQGLYTVVSEQAGRREELTVRLNRDLTVEAPVPALFTAVPIAGAATSHEYYTNPAQQFSIEATTGGEDKPSLLVFVRAPGQDKAGSWRRKICRIYDAAARLILEGTDSNCRHDATHGWFAFSTSLPSGAYLVEIGDTQSSRVFPVWTAPTWQAQLFLMDREQGLLFSSLKLLYSHRMSGFNPANSDLKSTDVLATALFNGRRKLSGQSIHAALQGKFDNPMLGLIAAHHLVRHAESPEELNTLDLVLRNMERLLGTSAPDIRALRLMQARRLGKATPGGESFSFPPMLMAAYWGLMDAARDVPDLIAPDSLMERMGVSLEADSVWASCSTDILEGELSDKSLDWISNSFMGALEQLGHKEKGLDVARLSARLGVSQRLLANAAFKVTAKLDRIVSDVVLAVEATDDIDTKSKDAALRILKTVEEFQSSSNNSLLKALAKSITDKNLLK